MPSIGATVETATGLRVLIKSEGVDLSVQATHRHACGGTVETGSVARCPNCNQLLFPVFKFDTSDPALANLELWRRRFLEILVCPACALYMEPYWLLFDDHSIVVKGGERDGGMRLLEIQTPYDERAIELRSLTQEEDPRRPEALDALLNRRVSPGVYHQLGGIPFKGVHESLQCPLCDESMCFAGVVDYDDLNVPLYEAGQRPVALVIGDGDCLNFYTCVECDVVGVRWAR